MPQVSVIIPAYNRATVIARAIDSALAQNVEDIEIIVVDDASTDETCGVVAGYGDARVRLLTHQTNQFAAAARNTGMSAARGDYIAFLDSDDAWRADKLALQLARIEALPEEWGCVYAGARLFKNGSERPVESLPVFEGQLLKRYLIGEFVIWTPTFLFRRACLERVGLMDVTLRRGQDRDFFIRLLQHYKLAAVFECVTDIYLETGKPLADIALASRETLLRKHHTLLQSLGATTYRKAYARQWMLQAEQFAVEGVRARSIRYGLKAVAMWPFLPVRRYAALCYKILQGRAAAP